MAELAILQRRDYTIDDRGGATGELYEFIVDAVNSARAAMNAVIASTYDVYRRTRDRLSQVDCIVVAKSRHYSPLQVASTIELLTGRQFHVTTQQIPEFMGGGTKYELSEIDDEGEDWAYASVNTSRPPTYEQFAKWLSYRGLA